jgi:hypothetical protein
VDDRTPYGAPVLLAQVVNHGLLLAIDPAGEEDDKERERRRRIHRVV